MEKKKKVRDACNVCYVLYTYVKFASENLLCYLELGQFREMAKRKWQQQSDVDVTDSFGDHFVLNAGLPQSSIVNNDQVCDAQKAISLIEKYIAVGSQYEVNLAYEMRMKYVTLLQQYRRPQCDTQNQQVNPFDLMSLSDFVFLFDPVLKELSRLMRHSYSRFVTTAAYRSFVDYVKPLHP
ncbi:hypothetical protein RFI_08003 [Reticulomyxa filosa]|uniref:Uncharacterized protein n=1 Tax=Reticulomyxa filosa TaxID=46433 RepID=X6NTN1_RETFI|nr:hypothetical protein RFI_08003 [Reticulomyxa filosa]|eukprot:ETO29124.1 hypothetical protein RFI_08003 [Reticulomyxa filosa]